MMKATARTLTGGGALWGDRSGHSAGRCVAGVAGASCGPTNARWALLSGVSLLTERYAGHPKHLRGIAQDSRNPTHYISR